MAEIPKELKQRLFERNPMLCCWMHDIFTYAGCAMLLIGIIGDAMNKVIWLETTNWFIMAVGLWMLGIFSWFRGYYSAKEKQIRSQLLQSYEEAILFKLILRRLVIFYQSTLLLLKEHRGFDYPLPLVTQFDKRGSASL